MHCICQYIKSNFYENLVHKYRRGRSWTFTFSTLFEIMFTINAGKYLKAIYRYLFVRRFQIRMRSVDMTLC